MTQQDLANIMNIKVQQINKYVLNKQRMSLEVAVNISCILHCCVSELYEWIEAGNKE